MSRFTPMSLAAATLLALSSAASAQTQWPAAQLTPQTPLAPAAIPMFVNRLPVLDVTPEAAWATYPKIQTVTPAELAAANGPYTLRMCEFTSDVLPPGTPGVVNPTHVWGYAKGTCPTTRDTYLGPVFVNQRGTPTSIRYVNDLPLAPELSQVIAYRDSVDQTLHWADPANLMCSHGMAANPADCTYPFRARPIPAVPHLHGGEVPPMLDGGPDAWFSSDPLAPQQGPAYYSSPAAIPAAANEAVYTYPNTQEPAPLWFHDHTLGATRLNVFAGLAGGYYIVDESQDVPASLRGVGGATQIVPIILQDRMFDTTGELFFTAGTKGNVLWALNPEHPYWNPEFVGDTIVVNGKAWPFLEVQQKRYRFLFLNGSNARTYELFLTDRTTKVNGPPMYVIGTDGGYLDSAVAIDPNALKPTPSKLVIMPGERYEVVVDFTNVAAGARLLLKNVGKTPYPGGATPIGGLGQIMEFRVTGPATSPGLAYDPVATPAIRGAATKIAPLVNFATGTAAVAAQKTRQVTLNEVMGMPVTATNPIDGTATAYPGGPLEILVNNTKWSGASARNVRGTDPTPPPWFRGDFVRIGQNWYSELPQEGETELWEIVNLTADSHPIHLHLVQFQLLNRQKFDVAKYNAVYGAAFPFVPDPMNPAMPLMMGMNTCSGAVYCPGFGPPLDVNPSAASGGKYGGNPDVLASLKGLPAPATPQETGWKDTVQAPPGQVTRVLVRWAPTDLAAATPPAGAFFPFDPAGIVGTQQYGYVWHCHIIDHEDNEMMRPDVVQANLTATRTITQGVDY
jgi:FtsP/CotA-like multicopper oxidase with cupredoxin domain